MLLLVLGESFWSSFQLDCRNELRCKEHEGWPMTLWQVKVVQETQETLEFSGLSWDPSTPIPNSPSGSRGHPLIHKYLPIPCQGILVMSIDPRMSVPHLSEYPGIILSMDNPRMVRVTRESWDTLTGEGGGGGGMSMCAFMANPRMVTVTCTCTRDTLTFGVP